LAQACMAAAHGDLKGAAAKWAPAASVCVVMASKGYPGKPEVGQEIAGLDENEGSASPATVFHAGTRREGTKYYTSGGRVLSAVAAGKELADCRRIVYDICSRIGFEGRQFRRDIAAGGDQKSRAAAEVSNG
jgi:phosphoribosylamine--glycine ligase